MDISIAMVQCGLKIADYYNEESFNRRIVSIFESIEEEVDLVVFPELIGLWIPLLRGRKDISIRSMIIATVLSNPFEALTSFLTGRGISFPFYLNWKRSLDTWIEPFRYAARKYNTYVCPGSMFLPRFDWEIAKGWHVRGKEIYNTSCLINRKGKIMGFTRKNNLTADEVKLGIKPGNPIDLMAYDTELGRIGILICLDGFYEGAVETLDRQGCRIILQPSANPVKWESPPRRGTEISQEEEWLTYGLGSLIQERENIDISVNVMSVSDILGHKDEGKSNVFVNVAREKYAMVKRISKEAIAEEYRKYVGLSVIADGFDTDEIIYFRLGVG